MKKDRIEKNCLSYWYPKLLAAGLPVPKTEIVYTAIQMEDLLDGNEPEPVCDDDTVYTLGLLCVDLRAAMKRISFSGPLFLRTGLTSGKHRWKDTCFLSDRSKLMQHVRSLVEISAMCGRATDVWCVREMLPVPPIGILHLYGDMPLAREVRCFIEDGKVLCGHPYWPLDSILEGLPGDTQYREEVAAGMFGRAATHCGTPEVIELQDRVAHVFDGDGAWSVDLLWTDNGWYVTDMAVAERSWHWPGCPIAAERGWPTK